MGIFDFFSGDDARQAAGDQAGGIKQGYAKLGDFSNQARTSLGDTMAKSVAPFQANLTTGQAGQGAYADATGANGVAGQDAARANFKTDPGYQFNMDQMIQNVLRGQAATGQLNSGATNTDILTQAHGLADNQWQSYIKNLQPFLQSSATAAQGASGATQNIGSQIAGSLTKQGDAAYGSQVGIGNANANADLANYNASGNLWNMFQNLAGDAATIAGGKK